MTGQAKMSIEEKATILICLLQDEISVNPRTIGKMTINYRIKSNIFLDKIRHIFGDIDEITWVKILKFIREEPKFKDYYESLLRVPFEHDGGSIMHFPEIYNGDGKVLVRTKVEIKNLGYFYPDVPGIENRSWKKGELVYVPVDKAERFLKIKWLEKVESN